MSHKLISFQVDSTIKTAWEKLEYSSEQKSASLQRLEVMLSDAYQNFITSLYIEVDSCTRGLEKEIERFNQQKAVFGDKKHSLPNIDSLPINQRIKIVKHSIDQLIQAYQGRIGIIKRCITKINKMTKYLLIDLEPVYTVDKGNDYTEGRLNMLQNKIEQLENEVRQKRNVDSNLKESISTLMESTGRDEDSDIKSMLKSYTLTPSQQEILSKVQTELQTTKFDREERINELTNRIEHLYLLLAVDPRDKIALPTQPTAQTVEALEKEVTYLESQKADRLPSVIVLYTREIHRICDVLHIPARSRPTYSGNDLVGATEFYLDVLTQLNIRLLISKQSIELIEAYNDAKKKKAYPSIEEIYPRLVDSLAQFKKDNGFDLEYDGKIYIETLEKTELPEEMSIAPNRNLTKTYSNQVQYQPQSLKAQHFSPSDKRHARISLQSRDPFYH